MISLELAPGSPLFTIFIIFTLTFTIQIYFYWGIFMKLSFFEDQPVQNAVQSISVVICARNEYFNLKENLPSFLEQDHPDYEVVVVNHASDDDSSVLLANMADQYQNLKIIEIRENLNFFSGKKFPLSIGIKSAKNELIVVTDADCRPVTRAWLSLMASGFNVSTEVLLGYGAYEKQKGLLNKLIRFDTFQKAIQYLSFALSGMPYMGVGRNMAYLKTLFFKSGGFTSHYRILSGDDDLFINKVANKSNTRIIADPASFTVSESKKTFHHWMLQKRQHISTPLLYRFKHQLLLGIYSFSVIAFYLTLILLLVFGYNPPLILTILFLRLLSQWIVFNSGMIKLNERDLVWFTPVYELILLFINFFAFFSNLAFKTNKWK